MSQQSNNPTDSQSSSSAKPGLKKWNEWLDIIFKIVGIVIAIVGAFWVSDLKDKISAASLLAQREQAETNLRATMFNNLMERIVTKDQKAEPEKMLLLAELLALNFDEHFQFKPLLIGLRQQLKAEQLKTQKDRQKIRQLEAQKLELESVAKRIVDRQADMLRAAIRTQGDEYQQDDRKIQDIFTSDLFFKIKKFEKDDIILHDCNYIDATSLLILDIDVDNFEIDRSAATLKKTELDKEWVNKQQKPALFTNEGFSQCIVVVSPDTKTSPDSAYLLEIAVLKYDPEEKTVTVSVNVTSRTLRSVSMVYEFDITPFDFPLTDNTAIDSDHRFAIVQRGIINDEEIGLRLIWFPKGYITERERPINYSEMRELLKAKKESKEKTWWSWWLNLPPPPPMDSTL